MQNELISSIKAHLSDYSHFHKYWMGDIVVLVGTSTAGKTSIIHALKQLESNRLEDGGDLRGSQDELKALKSHNPEEIRILLSIMNEPCDVPFAIFSEQRSWKPEITSVEKQEAEKCIKIIKEKIKSLTTAEDKIIGNIFKNRNEKMFDDAFEYSRRGGNIIFDVLNIDELKSHALMRKFDGPMRVVLVYCPFHILSSRMEKRNQDAIVSGKLGNQRIGAFPLVQFSQIYSQRNAGQIGIELLTREQVTKSFDENFDNKVALDRLKGNKLPSDEQILIDKETMRREFLANLGFEDGIDAVEVTPKNQEFYSLFINSSVQRPEDSAELIHQGTYRRYS